MERRGGCTRCSDNADADNAMLARLLKEQRDAAEWLPSCLVPLALAALPIASFNWQLLGGGRE